MKKTFQAKHIPDELVLAAIDIIVNGRDFKQATLSEICTRLVAYPSKVVLAKLRSMERRETISTQCSCGCYGPYCRPEVYCWYPSQAKKFLEAEAQAKGT